MSYIDVRVHVFWVDLSFVMKHQSLAVRHFGTERHTAENVAKALRNILNQYVLMPLM